MARQYSVSELGKHAREIIAEANVSKEPIFISQNGHATALVIDADEYLAEKQALDEFMRIYKGESSIKPTWRVMDLEGALQA